MRSNLSFLNKVLLLSVLLSLLIKYGGKLLPLNATSTTAAIAVVVPTLIMAAILGWRARRFSITGNAQRQLWEQREPSSRESGL
ncbi:hypothetical protein [Neosynechococcus sphagnicola]|uniref:hypothetical protein n=1 Tax=Neosynechococcus sphagnicola TaxID=1501145 RepID=UPI00138DD329|nr:hypothetical protein [Neosynechococcus sphagnicola]